MILSFLKFIIQCNTRQKPTNSLNYLGLGAVGRGMNGVMSWVEGKEREADTGEREKPGEWSDGGRRGGIKLYKTHLSTMEKVKAHDRYKHICYWVVQLLYFDGLESVLSTQVGSFWLDSMCVYIHLLYSTVVWLFFNFFFSIVANVQQAAHPQTPPDSPKSFFLWTDVSTTPDPLVVVLHSAVGNRQSCGSPSNESTNFWGHTKGLLGFSEIKIYTLFFFFSVVHWFLPQLTSL